MAEDENEKEAVEENSGGGMTKKLVFGGIGLALVAAGIIARPMIMNMISPPAEEDTNESAEEQIAEKSGPALYNSLHPPLVVNFRDSQGDAHFMQITMEVMARDQNVINAVRDHTPVIRNNLILLYGNARYDEVITRAGKEKMLAEGLSEIQKVLTERIGEGGVEALYFTSLIIQ